MQQQLQELKRFKRFKLEYFHDLEDVLKQPDLLRFNMKATTISTSAETLASSSATVSSVATSASTSRDEAGEVTTAAISEASGTSGSGEVAGLTGYQFERWFWEHIAASDVCEPGEAGENDTHRTSGEEDNDEDAVYKRLEAELASPGTVFLFHDDERNLVKMEQTDNVLELLKGYTDMANKAQAALATIREATAVAVATTDEDESTTDDVDDETADNEATDDPLDEADTVDILETGEESEEEPENESLEEDTDNTVDNVEDTDGAADGDVDNAIDPVEADLHTILHWQYAIIFLTAREGDIDFDYLYSAAVRAGRYKVLKRATFAVDTEDETNPAPEETAPMVIEETVEETVEERAETASTELAAESEVAANTADTEEDTEEADGSESDESEIGTDGSYVTPQNSPESTEAVRGVGSLSASDKLALADVAVFITRHFFYCEVFVLKTATSSAGLGNTVDLTGTKLFLTNRGKNVAATGVLTQGTKKILVKAGSTVSSDNRLPMQKGQTSSATLRQKLIDDGIIVDGSLSVTTSFIAQVRQRQSFWDSRQAV